MERSENKIFKLVITESKRVDDRSGQNASDYWVHDVHPGEYAFQWTNIQYGPATPGEAYYAVAVVTTTQVEYGGVNRVFHASSSFRDTTVKPGTLHVTLYRYQIEAGMKIFGGEIVEGVSLTKTRLANTDAARCVRDEVTYRIGKRIIDSTRAVSLDHPEREPQRHAPIRGDKGIHELPAVWMRGHCRCAYHRDRWMREHLAAIAEWRASEARKAKMIAAVSA